MFKKALVLGAALSALTACDPVALGIGSGIVLLNTAPVLDDARVDTTRTQISYLAAQVERFNVYQLDYPTEEQGLEALVTMPEELIRPEAYPEGGYIQELPLDAWGRPFQYKRYYGGHSYIIFSYGADGKPGGEGLNADLFSHEPRFQQ